MNGNLKLTIHLKYYNLTDIIINAYYQVYKHTSRNYPEHIYEQAFVTELCKQDLQEWVTTG